MPPLTVGELQVILSGDTSRLDRDMDRLDNRAGATEKVHTAAWQRTGVAAGEALAAGVGAGVDKLTRDAQGKLRNSRGQFATEAEILAAGMQPAFRKGGEDAGGVLAKGMRSGLIRNSPLIAAAIGGALIAGAPLVTAGAVALFAGAGAVAASQSLEIREAWTGLGHEIRGGMVADAAVMVPAYTKMADQIGASFQRMRPMIREAFADSVPLVDSFSDGVIALAENAMPGMVRAIAAGEPVFEGLEDFLASTATGVTGLLDGISSHGPAAGAVFTSLGAVVGDLLPILGELLGQGAELASDVLPAVAVATGTTLDVLQMLGPMLPGIVTGFVAFKAAQTAAGYLQTFAVQAQYATIAMTGSVSAGTKVGGVLAGLGKSLPLVGIAVGVVTSAMAQGEAQLDGWARALLEGGHAASVARQEMRDTAASAEEMASGWSGAAGAFFGAGVGLQASAIASGEAMGMAEERADALEAAMTPLELAEQRVTQATNLLTEKLDRYGAGSNEAEGAARALESAEREREQQSAALERAIDGVTSAMVTQAEQALAAASSDFAYRDSQQKLADQLLAVESAMGDSKITASEMSGIMLGLEKDTLAVAEAAGRLAADALPAGTSELKLQQAAAAGSLAELLRLRDMMGAQFPAALNQTIANLQQSGVALSNTSGAASMTAGRMRDLGLAVTEIPGQKFVQIDAPTGPQIQQLKDLGYHVINLPNGDVYVAANTADAAAAVNSLVAGINNRVATITVRATMPDLPGTSQRMGTFASGGQMPARKLALVGEQGPELLFPDRAAYVATAQQTAAILAARQSASFLPTSGAAFMTQAAPGNTVRATGTGSASVGGVTEKHYHMHAAVTHTISLPEFISLQKQADALYG